jgi:hypothetical protein
MVNDINILKFNNLFFGIQYALKTEIILIPFHFEVLIMASKHNNTALLLGAGLAVTSMIIFPAVAMRMGLGASLTGALRIALMKASNKAVHSS